MRLDTMVCFMIPFAFARSSKDLDKSGSVKEHYSHSTNDPDLNLDLDWMISSEALILVWKS